eukprot:m.263397 g.263397  ORF g.263397 m.263397 type:complete len:177 (-) comp53274_c0_seq1:47-577(-)
MDFGGKCLTPSQFIPIFLVIFLTAAGIVLYAVIVVMRRRADMLWRIHADDIIVSDPPEMLGRGAFGVVVKGELNGTAVAIKRALPKPPSAKLVKDKDGDEMEPVEELVIEEEAVGDFGKTMAMASKYSNSINSGERRLIKALGDSSTQGSNASMTRASRSSRSARLRQYLSAKYVI